MVAKAKPRTTHHKNPKNKNIFGNIVDIATLISLILAEVGICASIDPVFNGWLKKVVIETGLPSWVITILFPTTLILIPSLFRFKTIVAYLQERVQIFLAVTSMMLIAVGLTKIISIILTEPPGEFTEPITKMHFIRISNDDNPRDMDSFWMGKFEVAQKQWNIIMENNPSKFKNDEYPIENVNWNDVVNGFIKELNKRAKNLEIIGKVVYRLPTKAEWEYVCRKGKEGSYSYETNNIDRFACYNSSKKRESTCRIGSKKPDGMGLHDIIGNVREWCQDKIAEGGHIVKGGAWNTVNKKLLTCNYSCGVRPHECRNDLGFRLVADSYTSWDILIGIIFILFGIIVAVFRFFKIKNKSLKRR